MEIFTIGHSIHEKDEFLEILKSFNIEMLVDVRSFPGSRYLPHFNKENMQKWVNESGIKYVHLPKLGGRRRKLEEIDENLINGWKHIAFKNYAAYTLTDDFEKALLELIELGKKQKVCIMCAEGVPWRCHRLIISNSLYFKKVKVFHILQKNKAIKHEIDKFGAKPIKKGKTVIYPLDKK